jgi:hypothetical protein
LAAQTRVKPSAEVLVEGELSPFEHERIFQILKKRFTVSQPKYVELPDEDLATRITVTFRHRYDSSFFTQVFMGGWRDLKDILKEVRHRRGGAGAAFNLVFADDSTKLVFKIGLLDSDQVSSALDQIGHLTSIVKKIADSWSAEEPLAVFECIFDGPTDRWHEFRGHGFSGQSSLRFDDEKSVWTKVQ